MTSPSPIALTEALGMSQRLGALGPGPIETTIEHARTFVSALADVHGTVIDLGSGGGIPGLVIAVDRPDLSLVLIDRRQQRTDLCRRLVARLDLADRVRVMTVDVSRASVRHDLGPVDAVVARGFGPPMSTARCASSLLAPGGLLVVSEPPAGDRWDDAELASLGLQRGDWTSGPSSWVLSLRRC